MSISNKSICSSTVGHRMCLLAWERVSNAECRSESLRLGPQLTTVPPSTVFQFSSPPDAAASDQTQSLGSAMSSCWHSPAQTLYSADQLNSQLLAPHNMTLCNHHFVTNPSSPWTIVFHRPWNSEQSYGIRYLSQNFYIFVEFCRFDKRMTSSPSGVHLQTGYQKWQW